MEQPKSILIVDDDPDLVETTALMLQSAGYDVVTAKSGAEAMQKLKKRAPDLILLDVMMGTIAEGFDLSYELRAAPALSKIPIIMLSAVSKKTGMDFAAEKGSEFMPVEEFLDKPVHPQKLLAKVAEVLRRRKEAQE